MSPGDYPAEMLPPARGVQRGQRVADQILGELRRQIAAGEFTRGARLPTERELAERYSVSQPTIREAVRALSAMGLVEVRHGSGAFVTADPGRLLASALGTVMQLESISVPDMIALLRVLLAHASEIAVERATATDIGLLREAHDRIGRSGTPAEAASAVGDFLQVMARAAHEPLVSALIHFLVGLVIQLEESTGFARTTATYPFAVGDLQSVRREIVEGMVRRDTAAVKDAVQRYTEMVTKMISEHEVLASARLSDPRFARVLDGITDLLPRS